MNHQRNRISSPGARGRLLIAMVVVGCSASGQNPIDVGRGSGGSVDAGGGGLSAGGGTGGNDGAAQADPSTGGAGGGISDSRSAAGEDHRPSDLATEASAGSPATAACEKPHDPGVVAESLMSAGRMRQLRLFVPRGYDGRTRLPLVFNLHPTGGTPAAMASSSGLEAVADREGFLIAALAAVNGTWNVAQAASAPDDVAFASDTIAYLGSKLCLDTKRVYSTGFSGGARMSSRLACQLPEQIAAIAPIAGVRWPAPCPGRPVPVVTFHGLADTNNTYAGHARDEWVESVEDAILGWATKNGCNLTRVEEDPPGPISIYSYAGCQQGATVKLFRIDNGGHTLFRTPIDAPLEAWNFMKAFALP